jgi:hypothetical protein
VLIVTSVDVAVVVFAVIIIHHVDVVVAAGGSDIALAGSGSCNIMRVYHDVT